MRVGRRWVRSGLLLAAAACLVACMEEATEPSCTTQTGEPYMRPCACTTGGIGVQVCDANGAWGACSCPGQGGPAAPAAGTGAPTSGTGGMSVAPTPDAGVVDSAVTPTVDAGGAGDSAVGPTCTLDVDCNAPTPACVGGACVECSMNAHCASDSCDTSTNTCAPTGCMSNPDCSAPTPVCDTTNGVCVECKAKSDCSGATPVCGPDLTCVACMMPMDCPVCLPSFVPCCSTTNECSCAFIACPP